MVQNAAFTALKRQGKSKKYGKSENKWVKVEERWKRKSFLPPSETLINKGSFGDLVEVEEK